MHGGADEGGRARSFIRMKAAGHGFEGADSRSAPVPLGAVVERHLGARRK